MRTHSLRSLSRRIKVSPVELKVVRNVFPPNILIKKTSIYGDSENYGGVFSSASSLLPSVPK